MTTRLSSLLRRLGLPGLGLGLSVAVGCHSSSSSPAVTHPPGLDAAVAGSCTITPPVPSDWRLHADGTLFRDALNRVVVLRGVDAGERSKFAPYVPFDFPDGGYATALEAYMTIAASWGIDAMRVPFAWAALEPVQGQDDSSWLSMYDQLLDSAWAHGIYTVVDFHQDDYAEALCGDGFPDWTIPDAGPPHHDCIDWKVLGEEDDSGVPEAYDRFWDASTGLQTLYTSAWDVLLARYADKPGVIGFEPFNEPEQGDDPDLVGFEETTLTDFYGVIGTHMRSLAPSSLVFVDPPGIDGALLTTNLGQPASTGIVFAPHYYPLTGIGTPPQQGLQAWATIGQTWNVPVFVGEFGASIAAGTPDYMTSIWNAFDALGMSGTEWEYSIAAEAWDGEYYSVVNDDGGENAVAAALVRPFARAVAGSAITSGYDPTSQTFTMAYTPTSGVSEVSFPARAYPTGYSVAITGGCFDVTSKPGTMLVQPSGSTQVTLTVTPSGASGDQ